MIKSKRLLFKPFTYDDFEDLKAIFGNEAVCQYLPAPLHKKDDEIRKWLNHFVRTFNDELGNKIYAIYLQDTTTVIGYGGLSYVKEFDAIEIMYGFNEEYWRKGYAKETSIRMKSLAIELGYNSLIALADIGNFGSQKILMYTGFQKIKQISIWGIDAYYYEMKL